MDLPETLKKDATKYCVKKSSYRKQPFAKSTDSFSFLKMLETQNFLFIRALQFSCSRKTNTNSSSMKCRDLL